MTIDIPKLMKQFKPNPAKDAAKEFYDAFLNEGIRRGDNVGTFTRTVYHKTIHSRRTLEDRKAGVDFLVNNGFIDAATDCWTGKAWQN